MTRRCDVDRCHEDYTVETSDGEKYCGEHFMEYAGDVTEYSVLDDEN